MTEAADLFPGREGLDIDALRALDPTETRGGGVRTFQVGWFDPDDEAPIVGIDYRCDYRSEEEYGAGQLRRALCGEDVRRFQMLEDRRGHIAVFSDVNAIAISNLPMHLDGPPKWGDDLGGHGGNVRYAEDWLSSLPYAQGHENSRGLARNDSVPELRAAAKALGIKPLPARRADLVTALVCHLDAPVSRPLSWPGWFHHGDILVLRADTGPTAAAVGLLRAAAQRRTLGFAPTSGPFATGLFLCDTNDMGPLLWKKIHGDFDAHDAAIAAVDAVFDALAEQDQPQRPNAAVLPITRDGVTTYYVNTPHGDRWNRVYCRGRYTLEQIAGRQHIIDAEAEAAAKR